MQSIRGLQGCTGGCQKYIIHLRMNGRGGLTVGENYHKGRKSMKGNNYLGRKRPAPSGEQNFE